METPNDLFSMILENGPSSETFFLVLSKMKEDGQLEKVIQECSQALKIFPHDVRIRRLLAETYLEIGQLSRAEEEMKVVTNQINDLISAYKLQAEIFHRQGKDAEAVQSLELYLKHSKDEEALHLIETLSPQKEIPVVMSEPATEDIPRSIEEELEEPPPADRKGLLEIATPTLAEIYFDQGQLREAIEIYEKVVSQNPEDAHSRQRLEEMKAMALAEEKLAEEREIVDAALQGKKKMITILEAWRTNIRDNLGKPVSSS